MKKLIPLLLLLSILLTGCVGAPLNTESTTTGDRNPNAQNPEPETAIKVEDVEKDPEGSVDQAIRDATDGLFDDEAEIMEIIAESLENGSVTLHAKGDTLFAMLAGDTGIKELTGTLYSSDETESRVIDLLVGMPDGTLSNRLHLSQDAVALQSPWVLGADGTYLMSIETLANDGWFYDVIAAVFEKLAVPEGYMSEAFRVRDGLLQFSDMSLELPENGLLNKMLASMDREIKVEDTKDANGKTVPCIVVSYQINNATLWSALETAVKEIELNDEILELIGIANESEMTEDEIRDMLLETVESYIETLNDTALIRLTASAKINMLTAKAIGVEIEGTVKDVKTNTSETIRVGCTFASNSVLLNGSLEGKETQSASLWLKKDEKDGTVSYDAALGLNAADLEMQIGVGVTYESESGEFELRLTVDDPESDEDTEILLEGAVTKEDKQAKVALHSLTVGELTIRFEISATFETDTDTPAIPEDAVDIGGMTAEEWENFVAAIEAGPLGQLIASMQENEEVSSDEVDQ